MLKKKYSHLKIEKKWQKKWEEENIYEYTEDGNNKKKFYILDMFPYPSGDGLHMGHTESYTASDIIFRYKKMQGFNVLHPQGFDSFGLPAENYAIKTGIHPKKTTETNTGNYIKQMKMLGLGHDLEHLVYTSKPDYYKWTQWLFGKFFEGGFVERKTDKINWCSSCNTGIANEQVEGGKCERCKTEIEQRKIPGWFFKITDFADELIDDLDIVDWPEHTKKNQRNWIGKSDGAKIKFAVKTKTPISADISTQVFGSQAQPDHSQKHTPEIEVFTTRPDTLFGATYMVLAPEHKLIERLKDQIENFNEVEKYQKETKIKTELDRLEAKEKTGVELKGIKAVNPANQEEIPVYIADYVLDGYGTGAIMAVPAHDERDFEFAFNFNIPMRFINDFNHIQIGDIDENNEIDISEINLSEELKSKKSFFVTILNKEKVKKIVRSSSVFNKKNRLINSGKFNGMDSKEGGKKIVEFVGGELTSTYRLRDWSISRQRYWGCPIPIVYSPEGEAEFVGEENLPWLLPEDVDFVPDGTAPLAKSKELKERVEKLFGKGWTPEVDTMDTFVDSSWYFLRYPDTENEREFCSPEKLKYWLPVDLYIGGAEHTYMHLLFARFFTKAMYKMGLINFNEPFIKLKHQGMVLDKEGVKMSKSKGNVTNPNEMIQRFGADVVRTYMMFATPLEDEVIWNEDNIVGVYRFLEKVWKLSEKVSSERNDDISKKLHQTIKSVSYQIDNVKLNTAVSDMMKFVNFAIKQDKINFDDYQKFLKILSPFAPHICDELAGKILLKTVWPEYDEKLIQNDEVIIPIQINGKRRSDIKVAVDISEEEIMQEVRKIPELEKWLSGEIRKIIFIQNKILNVIVG